MSLLEFFWGKKYKKVKIVQEDKHLSVHTFIEGEKTIFDENTAFTEAEAKELRDRFLEEMIQNDLSKAINDASRLMLDQKYKECIACYQAIAQTYPTEKAIAESQIGAAYYFLGFYAKAIDYYVMARESGADGAMIDDNIWEACTTIYSKTKNKRAIRKYLELCPRGNYLGKAIHILNE